MDPGISQLATTLVPPADPFEAEVRRAELRIRALEEAHRRIREAKLGDLPSRVDEMCAELLDADGLESVPDLEPLVEGLLYRPTFARVIGASGHGKSFVMLDMAARIGAGLSWGDKRVRQGSVIYIAAEGGRGIKKRKRAWEQVNGRKMTGVRFLPRPVQTTAEEWDVLIEVCRKEAPAMIVVDTQARVTVGVDENGNTEMGVVVDAVERLVAGTQACVVFVHHKGLKGEHGRGAGAVRAALQTEFSVRMDKDTVVVGGGAEAKNKDDANTDDLVFKMHVVDLGLDAYGFPLSSVVPIFLPGELAPSRHHVSDEELTGKLGEVALMVKEVFAEGNGGTKADMRRVAVAERKIITVEATWHRVWNQLIVRRIICRIKGSQNWRYVPVEDRDKVVEAVGDDPNGKSGFYAP